MTYDPSADLELQADKYARETYPRAISQPDSMK